MPRSKITETTQNLIRQRANYLCEFCHANERWQYVKFTVDHIIPLSLGGDDNTDNLALACFHCNRRKTNKLVAVDPQSKVEVSLFNPRLDSWDKHFIWSVDRLQVIGVTAIGRATVNALLLNRNRVIPIRGADLEIGRHPPDDDPKAFQLF
jgi:HNH endonuclease